MIQTRFKLTSNWACGELELERIEGPKITPNIVKIGDRWVPFRPASRGKTLGLGGAALVPAVVGLEVVLSGTKMFVHAEELEFSVVGEDSLTRLTQANRG